MPLGPAGKKILSKMRAEYGSKKGASVFYAKENKSSKFARLIKNKKKK